jgi:GTP-binding protein LepA
MNSVRNFCIIAHIDHGKSTLADRMLEITGTVEMRKMRAQLLDQMDIEQERGITIKLQPVRMEYKQYILNLIDTPGHVDFTYEVSRSLAACEGAILLVDATQGVQAQTLANLYLALEQNLAIIPAINKIDLPAAQIDQTEAQIIHLLGCSREEIFRVSGKTGEGVERLLRAVIEEVPSPNDHSSLPLRALVFDSKYDEYKGVVAYVRIVDGAIRKGEKIRMIGTDAFGEALEVGFFKPHLVPSDELQAGEIGYIVTGLKEVQKCQVGDTITAVSRQSASRNSDFFEEQSGVGRQYLNQAVLPLSGYKQVKPMVFAGIFCKEGSDYPHLRDAMEKLKLNDAALTFEPENSKALGFGFRCGFLGLLHLEIVQERLHREYGLNLMVTAPSVAYKLFLRNDPSREIIMKSPQEFPDPSVILYISEPMMDIEILAPKGYLGSVMSLAQSKRALYRNTEYLDESTVIAGYTMPLSSILTDFYDKLKSVSAGFASLNYEFKGYEPADVVKLEIHVAEENVESLAVITYRDIAQGEGRLIVEKLKNILPKEMFEVKLQAVIGGKVVASERIAPLRKDVTAKLYGGDVTRKMKLLEKQKKGKKKMMKGGHVDIPPEAFIAILKK